MILFLQFRSEEDKKNFCFICSQASHEFERRAEGFDYHVKNNHNMWNYIYLSIYLDQIDISDHNAIQKYIYDMVSNHLQMNIKHWYQNYSLIF
jgi:inositol 1,4,5-triphosphate receptor type 1